MQRARWMLTAVLIVVGVLVVAAAGVATPWLFADPSNDRTWQAEVERLPRVRFSGDTLVTIEDVRDFRYDATGAAVPSWRTETFDVREIRRLWFFFAPFAPNIPAIAHLFLSFEAADGRFIAFSVEARKERGEAYSPIRGLLPAYETIVVIATEADVAGVRAVVRGEPLYLFPSNATPEQSQAIFVGLLERAAGLESDPEFYHTIWNNCTTNLVEPVNRVVEQDVAWWETLTPGYSVEEAWGRGWLATELPVPDAMLAHRVDDRVRAAYGEADFSRRVRVSPPAARPLEP